MNNEYTNTNIDVELTEEEIYTCEDSNVKWGVIEKFKIKDLIEDFKDSKNSSPTAFGGKLEVRPHYQRLFVYKPKMQAEVINSIRNGTPLGPMIYHEHGDGTYSLFDGQQRSLSILYFCHDKFPIFLKDEYGNKKRYIFSDLKEERTDIYYKILNYELDIRTVSGKEGDIVHMFNVINRQGEQLSSQEKRNIFYSSGGWLPDAQHAFCTEGCDGYDISKNFISCRINRQDLLEIALTWISHYQNMKIEDYMDLHHRDADADELWFFFENVCDWVNKHFSKWFGKLPNGALSLNHRWGDLYKIAMTNGMWKEGKALDDEINNYLTNTKVGEFKESGLIPYLITGEIKHLKAKPFSSDIKKRVYHRQNGICPCCSQHHEYANMDGHHIEAQLLGGATTEENCLMVCKTCHSEIHAGKYSTQELKNIKNK